MAAPSHAKPCFKENMKIRAGAFVLPCKREKPQAHNLAGD